MADAAIEGELADVRGIGLDRLRDSPDGRLRAGVQRLLHTLDVPAGRIENGSGSPDRSGRRV
ncbi:hypothetical protein [Frankia tisae]|uniref:hypothetical protein n=1 Tax=Frankia tisae TaxID=2950104 RepID=UPI0021C05CD8|nr:hypothetical protein [Frankia tisae]